MCFRGSIAPASLKHQMSWAAADLSMIVFPGLYCPGLIEACTWPSRCPSRARCFRGSIAPASLKLVLDRERQFVRGACFRGSIAPASLKRIARVDGTERQLGVFPGLYCPGLIEAA